LWRVRGLAVVVGLVTLLTLACGAGAGDKQAGQLRLVKVIDGLAAPIDLTAPRSEPGRLYVVEQAGRIIVVENGRAVRTFLDIRNIVRSGGEQGLLSVAFHPSYAQNHRFYVDYTDLSGNTRVVEYRSDATQAIPGSRRQLLFIRQPYPNHNGGQLVFGPNGLLYVGMGDGGAGGDPENRAQNPRSLLGKILTLNVNVKSPRPRIAALGTRNPWRISFDRKNGDMYMGDVGQNAWEEIDYRSRAKLGQLANYGWDAFEGRSSYEPKRLGPGQLVRPVYVYGHGGGNCSVTGGFVYRGSAVPAAAGRYFFGDFCSGTVWSLEISGGRATSVRREPFTVGSLSSFGEDAHGELYVVSQGGTIYRLAG
jgi:glucose/arabinose dehydrogenase